MTRSSFENIRVVLAEPNMKLRTVLKNSLFEFGFRHVQATGHLSQIVGAVEAGNADLLIADVALPKGDFNEYVYELRHGLHGTNPFLGVITLITKPSKAVVQGAIDSGADCVLAKPITADALMAAISVLAQRRKRFVVTSDYIGPDRRSAHRGPGDEIVRIDVPNPLLPRIIGHGRGARSQRSIEAAKHMVNEQKVLRHAFQIGWLMDRVVAEMAALKGGTLVGQPEHIERLCAVSKDLCRRLKNTRFAHVEEIILTLERMARGALRGHLCVDDIQLMRRMAEIIGSVFDPDRSANAAQYRRQVKRGINVFEPVSDQPETSPESAP